MRNILIQIALLLVSFLLIPFQAEAQIPDESINSQTAIQYVAQTYNVPATNLRLLQHRYSNYPLINKRLWMGTVINTATTRLYTVYVDSEGKVAKEEEYRKAENNAYTAKYGRFSPVLYNMLQSKKDDDKIKIGIWLKSNDYEAVSEVIKKYPQAKLWGHRPGPDTDSELYRQIYREMNDARKKTYRAASQPLEQFILSRGFRIYNRSNAAPVIFTELNKAFILEISQRPDIDRIYPDLTYHPALDISVPAVGAPVPWEAGIYGQGTRIAVIEGDGIDFNHTYIPDQDLLPTPTNYYNPDTPNIDGDGGHATQVAGVIASTYHSNVSFRGVSYSAKPLLSGNASSWNASDLITASEWAIGDTPNTRGQSLSSENQASVLNLSFEWDTNGQMDLADRYYDHIIYWHNKTVIAAAGNIVQGYSSYVASPAIGYNVIAVGAYDDRDSISWIGDNMWDGSKYLNPSSPNNDREKPEVTAPGVNITTTNIGNGWYTDNATSYSAPHVSGLAALLINRDTRLASWPEAVKAIIMASAIHNIEGNRGLSQYDGAGGVYAGLADEIVSKQQWTRLTITTSSFTQNGYLPYYYINNVKQGERVRVAISWDSHPPHEHPDFPTDPLKTNLNLYIYNSSNQLVTSSYTQDNNYEIVDFIALGNDTYSIRINNNRFEDLNEYLGIAWANFPDRNDIWAIRNSTFIGVSWSMYSFPFIPVPDNIGGQLDDDIPPGYGAYHYYTTSKQYGNYASIYPGGATRGWGYWTKVWVNTPVDMQGISPITITDFEISLLRGWNQIGQPFNWVTSWGQARVRYQGQTVSITEAQNLGWVKSTLYAYNSSTKTYYEIRPIGGELTPLIGYWMNSSVDGAVLIIPPIGQSTSGAPLSSSTTWSALLTASGTESADNAKPQFVSGANIQYDINDDPEPPTPPELPYIQVYFPHWDWQYASDNYTIDARPEAASITWSFEVYSKFASPAIITLTWDVSQVPSTYKTVQLQDGATGQRLIADMRTATSYWYLPASATYTRSFNFVVDTRSERVNTLYYRWNIFSIPLDTIPADFQAQLGDDATQTELDTISRFNPITGQYEYWSDSHYPPGLGTGYWIKLDANKEVDSWGNLAASANFTIHLVKGASKWNLIGHPFDFTVDWGDALIYNPATQETVSTTEAVSRGWIGRYLYWWSPSTQMYSYASPPDGELWPWYGYWVIANIFVDLIIPPTPMGQGLRSGTGGTPVPTDDKNIPMPPAPPPVRVRK